MRSKQTYQVSRIRRETRTFELHPTLSRASLVISRFRLTKKKAQNVRVRVFCCLVISGFPSSSVMKHEDKTIGHEACIIMMRANVPRVQRARKRNERRANNDVDCRGLTE